MASWKQIQNLHKCKNKFRHKWIDEGKEKDGYNNYCYTCKKCGKKKIKQSAYSASYYDEKSNYIGSLAPECVAKALDKEAIITFEDIDNWKAEPIKGNSHYILSHRSYALKNELGESVAHFATDGGVWIRRNSRLESTGQVFDISTYDGIKQATRYAYLMIKQQK